MFKKNFSFQKLIAVIFLFLSACFISHSEEITPVEKDVPSSVTPKDINNSYPAEKDLPREEIRESKAAGDKKINKKNYQSERIIITATKNEIDIRETGASVSVISGEEISDSGKIFISDLFRNIPGMDVVKQGSIGSSSSIAIRGSSSKNVLVLIDGVPVNDPIGGGGDKSFEFANFPADNIERIEIIRGPNSVLYGSESSAGVINIITKKGEGKPEFSFSAEGGSFLTFRETAAFTASNNFINFSLSVSRIDSEGVSKKANPDGSITNLENDPYHSTSISSRTRLKLFGNSSLDFNIHYINSESAVDDFNKDSPYIMFYSELFSTGLVFNQTVDFWNHKLSYSHISSNTKNIQEEPGGYDYTFLDGMNDRVEWQNNFNIDTENIKDTITLGFSGSFDTAAQIYNSTLYGSYTILPKKSISNFGLYLQNHLKIFDRLFLITGARYDFNQAFGSDFNYNISLSGIIPAIETRIKGNVGTGQKAPTIYQLYVPSNSLVAGNPALLPEKNFSFDIGFEQPLFKNLIVINAVYFNSTYTNLINFVEISPWFYKPFNVGKANMQGFELNFTFNLPYNLKIIAGYTFTKANLEGSDVQLARRPMDKFFSVLNWSFFDRRANINLTYSYTGIRKNLDYSSDNVMLAPYVKLDLALSFKIIDSIQIFAKIDNLTNSIYQEAYSFYMPGINAYGGITVKI